MRIKLSGGIWAAVALSVILVLSGCATVGSSSGDNVDPGKESYDRAQIKNRQALKIFEEGITQIDEVFHLRLSTIAHDVADKVSEKQTILTTVYYAAKDRVSGGKETDEYLEQLINPLLKPITDAYSLELDKLSSNLDRELMAISLEHATNLNSLIDTSALSTRKPLSVPENWTDFDHALRGLGYRAPYVGARIAFHLNTTLGSNSLAPLLGSINAIASRVFSRSIMRLGAATSVALLEGPLPVGKIFAAMRFLWTVYELAELQPNYQNEVLKTTKSNFELLRTTVNKSAVVSGLERVEAFDKLLLGIRVKPIPK